MNNAGGTYGSISADHELEGDLSVFDYTLNANMRRSEGEKLLKADGFLISRGHCSVLRLCQLAFPHLVRTKGEIVNVSSVAGLHNGAVSNFRTQKSF